MKLLLIGVIIAIILVPIFLFLVIYFTIKTDRGLIFGLKSKN